MIVKWLDAPEPHDYAAACDYLSLLEDPDKAAETATSMQTADIVKRKAKDILRASGLRLLPKDNPHVARNLQKIHDGWFLSPILLVRDRPLHIADGYHRVCATYMIDENTPIPCKLVDWWKRPGGRPRKAV